MLGWWPLTSTVPQSLEKTHLALRFWKGIGVEPGLSGASSQWSAMVLHVKSLLLDFTFLTSTSIFQTHSMSLPSWRLCQQGLVVVCVSQSSDIRHKLEYVSSEKRTFSPTLESWQMKQLFDRSGCVRLPKFLWNKQKVWGSVQQKLILKFLHGDTTPPHQIYTCKCKQ